MLYDTYKIFYIFLFITLHIYANLITYCYYKIIHINISKSDETYYIYHQTELLLSSIVITYFGWWKRVFSVSKNIMKNSYSELVGNESILQPSIQNLEADFSVFASCLLCLEYNIFLLIKPVATPLKDNQKVISNFLVRYIDHCFKGH